MPSLTDIATTVQPVKAMLVGRPGVGKTGALASLAKAGYELFILNCDNNINILVELLRDDKKALARVQAVTLTDLRKVDPTNKTTKPVGTPTAFLDALKLLSNWKEDKDAKDFGNPADWGPSKRVVVIDTITRLGEQAMDFVLASNGIKITEPRQQDWLTAQRQMSGLINLLNSDEFDTNVLCLSHIKSIDKPDEKGQMRPVNELPAGVGTAGSETIGGFFPTIVLMERQGSGDSVKRSIFTRPNGLLETKMPVISADRKYDSADGLAEIFKLLRGGVGPTD